MLKMIVDRFEGEMAILEYGQRTYIFPRKALPAQVKEGDVLDLIFKIDLEGRKHREKEIKDLMNELFE